jgi:hypothetical protein
MKDGECRLSLAVFLLRLKWGTLWPEAEPTIAAEQSQVNDNQHLNYSPQTIWGS